MRVAVTGASGFVGRHVTKALVERGADVVVAMHRTVPPALDGVECVTLDIADPGSDPFSTLGRPDVLVHLAWAGLPHYRAASHVDDELPKQKHFLRACLAGGLRRVAITGTCLEYGMAAGELDELRTATPATAYAKAKHLLAADIEQVCAEVGADFTWMRLFYLFGEGQAPTSLYSQLCSAVRRGDTHFPMSPGDQQRDFLPIDVAASHIAALALGPGSGRVNICSGQPTTIHAMATQWLAQWGADIVLERGMYPYPDYEPFAFWGSTRKLRASLELT